MNSQLTNNQVKKIENEILNCDRYIQKESRCSSDIRPEKVQNILNQTISHREKLISLLNGEDSWEKCLGNMAPFAKKII
jgi:hypothetical protein